MKSRSESLIRLKKFQVDEKRRRTVQIETMIAEFERMSTELEREVKTEQDRAGIQDPSHFAYPTYAKAANQRKARGLFRDDDGIVVPRVFPQLSTARVLTMERLEGRHLGEFLAGNPSSGEQQ